jgi:hypothetical protein
MNYPFSSPGVTSSRLMKPACPNVFNIKKRIGSRLLYDFKGMLAPVIEDHIGRFNKSLPPSSAVIHPAESSGRIIPGFSGWTRRRHGHRSSLRGADPTFEGRKTYRPGVQRLHLVRRAPFPRVQPTHHREARKKSRLL